MSKFFGNQQFNTRMVLDKAKEEGGGGGGAPSDKTPTPDHAKEIADLKAQNAAILKTLEALTGKKREDDDKKEDDLSDKARKMRADDDKKADDTKNLEAALKFSLGAPEFLKTNASLLPKGIEDVFKAAEKETFSNAIEKDQAIKSGIIQRFFEVQSNMDLLTPGLKNQLEEYLKLTKTGKQEKAQAIYSSIFEPAFEMLKRVKKAEALGKGLGGASDAEAAYKNKLMGLSKKHYLGEKPNGT